MGTFDWKRSLFFLFIVNEQDWNTIILIEYSVMGRENTIHITIEGRNDEKCLSKRRHQYLKPACCSLISHLMRWIKHLVGFRKHCEHADYIHWQHHQHRHCCSDGYWLLACLHEPFRSHDVGIRNRYGYQFCCGCYKYLYIMQLQYNGASFMISSLPVVADVVVVVAEVVLVVMDVVVVVVVVVTVVVVEVVEVDVVVVAYNNYFTRYFIDPS